MKQRLIVMGLLAGIIAMGLPYKVKTSKLMGLKVYAKERFKIANGKNLSKWRGAAKYYKAKQVLIEVKITNSREAVSGLTSEIYYFSEFEKNKVYQVHHKHVTNNIALDKYNLDRYDYEKHYNIHPNDPNPSRHPRSVNLPGKSTEYVAYVVILKDEEGKIVDGASNSSNLLKYLGTITKLNEGDKMTTRGVKE